MQPSQTTWLNPRAAGWPADTLQVMSALDTFMTRVRWAPLDVLLLDMPPGTGDAQISISQRLQLSGAVIISTPQVGAGMGCGCWA
jgi:Mrp family chromosome partitioning ATPase